jgi:tRNA A37 threonylcarbamoyltransferase TsaD
MEILRDFCTKGFFILVTPKSNILNKSAAMISSYGIQMYKKEKTLQNK